MKTEFQKRFVLEDVFYTGQYIRDAITECFPFKDGRYQGLARITNICLRESTGHANRSLDLGSLIPDITLTEEVPRDFSKFRSCGVIEGEVLHWPAEAASCFIPTYKGYICDMMKIEGRAVYSETAVKMWSELLSMRRADYRLCW
jgi:hypothetical protein